MTPTIRTCTPEDIRILVATIRASFRDVAERFGLTQENCPRHPSNCEAGWVQRDMDRGVTYFIIDEAGLIAGCVALEQAGYDICYLERLGVLPDRRRHGFGSALVAHVLSGAKLLGANRVQIGIIADDADLKNWYERIGFVAVESREFAHLPFRVTFMSYEVKHDCQ